MSSPSPNATRDLSALRLERATPPRPRRAGAWLVLVMVAGAAAVVLILGRLPRLRAVEVVVEPARVESPGAASGVVLASSGYVVARTKAAVSAKLAGRLEELAVEEGSRVEAGQVIARLENDALRADVDASQAQVAQAEAALARARADRDLASIEDERQRRLLDAQLGTRTAADAARASLMARVAAVAEAESLVRTAAARLAQSRVGLENANVRAPFSGVVLRKEAEVGEYVAPSVASGSLTRGAIVTMADLASLEVETDVAEGNVARLLDGMPVAIALDAVPDRRYRGRLRQVMPTAERQKATVQVKVALLDPDDRVKPEMSAKLQFLASEPDPASLAGPPRITIPADAVALGGTEGASAWVVEEGRARRVPVILGEALGDRVTVASGLSGGERVVVDPPADLRDGGTVKVRSP